MNILVVAHYQGDGSPSAIFIHDQIRAYLALGHQVRVLCPTAIGKRGWGGKRFQSLCRQEEIDGADYFYMRYLSLSQYGEKRFNTSSASFALKRCISWLLQNFRPDVIHAHTLGFDSELGALLKKWLHVPLVVTTHGSDTFIPYQNGQIAQLMPTCNTADHIIAVSSLLAKTVAFSGTNTPISVILNGFRVPNACTHHQSFPHSIIQVGSLIERKKVHNTITAFAQVKAHYPDAILTIIGQGPERTALELLAQELNISESVRFTGQLPNEEVLAEMAHSQFFCMPSVREGFGIVYLEAMASGCVTIGTQGEGVADLIVHGVNGFLVPPDKPDAIAKVIDWCLQNPETAASITERGIQDARSLTWEKNAAQYIRLFKRLVQECS